MRTRVVYLVCLALLLGAAAPSAAPSQSSGQQEKPEEEKPKKKKARKVWTNDDFPSRPALAAPKEEAKKPEKAKPLEELFAELDKARKEREFLREDRKAFEEGLNELYGQRFRARDSGEREMLDLAIEAAEVDVADAEQRLKELDTRIAELEKLTKGRKRPKPKSQPAPQTSPESSPP